jgi:hypothetical protein
MEEYKGIYYGDEEEEHYYEGGAHFKYIKLYKILEKLSKERNQKEKEEKEISSYIDTSNENNKKTRNTNNYLYNNKLTYNTFGNKIITRNDKFNNIDKNIFISVNKINNKKDLKNSFLFLKHKKIILLQEIKIITLINVDQIQYLRIIIDLKKIHLKSKIDYLHQ